MRASKCGQTRANKQRRSTSKHCSLGFLMVMSCAPELRAQGSRPRPRSYRFACTRCRPQGPELGIARPGQLNMTAPTFFGRFQQGQNDVPKSRQVRAERIDIFAASPYHRGTLDSRRLVCPSVIVGHGRCRRISKGRHRNLKRIANDQVHRRVRARAIVRRHRAGRGQEASSYPQLCLWRRLQAPPVL